jgi:hypothetical protein
VKESAVGVVLLLAVLLQVTVAPLFPVAGAVPDLTLLMLATVTVFLGPRWGMVCLPIVAVLLGFLTSHEPSVFILAYLPLLPLAAWMSGSGMPPTRFMQAIAAGALTGVWARTLLAAGAMASGADADIPGLIAVVLIPGLVLDLALLALAYAGCRVIGWEPQRASLRPQGYFNS